MKVIRSGVLGFCMGVRRAVEITRAAACSGTHESCSNTRKIFTLGPLIHNSRVLDELKHIGVTVLDGLPPEFHDETVIIRAHGIAPQLEQILCDRNCRIIDATCPKVKKNQLTAQQFERACVRLFIAGNTGHAEIAGLMGYAPSGIIAGNVVEADAAAFALKETDPQAQTALIAQTTIDEAEYQLIAHTIKKYFPELEITETVCTAVTERQNALRRLLKMTDAVVIAGDKNSANTGHLADIACKHGTPCVLAESAGDIPPEFFLYDTIGLCAGASAPDSLIDEIEQALIMGN